VMIAAIYARRSTDQSLREASLRVGSGVEHAHSR
jgi:hypothetical protein